MTVKSIIPEGVSGDWRVEKFEVTQEGANMWNLRVAINPGRGHTLIEPGHYTRLVRRNTSFKDGTVVMSDTPGEVETNRYFVTMAKGNVLINGLGLGVVLQMILAKDDVKHVTVIENSKDVIKLVAPHFTDPRLEIIHADALEWKPPRGMRYDAVWHDIWDYICADNLPEMKRLHSKYGRRAKWQGSWGREFCR